MAVKRQSLVLAAFADPWGSLDFQGNHILPGLRGLH